MLNVVLVQMNIRAGDREFNRARVRALLGTGPRPGSLVILPELFSTGFVPATGEEGPITIGAAADEQFLSELARELQCSVLGSTLSWGGQGLMENVSLLHDSSGTERHRYCKRHLMAQIGESKIYRAGTGSGVVLWEGIRLQTTLCYDLRFPELYREAVLRGSAEVISVQANWASLRHEHFGLLARARAVENQAWVVGVNRVGSLSTPTGLLEYRGGSLVVAPTGDVVALLGNAEQVETASIDNAISQQQRRAFQVLGDAVAY